MSFSFAGRLLAPIVAASALASCGLPPFTTAEQSITVRYNQFVPDLLYGVPLPLLPGFSDKSAPATTVPVPREARALQVTALTLNLKLQNTGPVPLRIKLYLSRESQDPYQTPALGGTEAEIDLPGKSDVVTKAFSVDPALLKENAMKLGYTFSSPGTTNTVTFQESDAVLVQHSVTAQIKLF